MGKSDVLLYILIIFVLLVFIIAVIIKLVLFIKSIKEELKYINIEIGRTEGREKSHWKKKKRQLLLSLIPFVKR